jgi:hypothetical protein
MLSKCQPSILLECSARFKCYRPMQLNVSKEILPPKLHSTVVEYGYAPSKKIVLTLEEPSLSTLLSSGILLGSDAERESKSEICSCGVDRLEDIFSGQSDGMCNGNLSACPTRRTLDAEQLFVRSRHRGIFKVWLFPGTQKEYKTLMTVFSTSCNDARKLHMREVRVRFLFYLEV